MIVKKLKSLFPLPTLLLLLNSVVFAVLAVASRVSAWGTLAWFLCAVYIYVTRVRGKGKMGFSFLFLSLVSLYVIRGVTEPLYIWATALYIVVLTFLFLGAIGFVIPRHERTLYMAQYLMLGMAAAWWASNALTDPFWLKTLFVAVGIYITTKERVRFLEQEWGKEQAVWYMLFSLLALEYIWSISLLSLYIIHTAALFLVFFIIMDDIVQHIRTSALTKEYMYKNVGLFALCSVAIGALAYWF